MQIDKENYITGPNAEAGLSPEGRRPKDDSPSTVSLNSTNTQVEAKTSLPRRKFSIEYKLKILETYEACETAMARGALLRKEGLYHSRLTAWRQQRDAGRLMPAIPNQSSKRLQQVTRENAALKKKLAQAEAIIDLQKKVSEILGQHILQPENSE